MSDAENAELFAKRDAWYAEAKEQTRETLPAFIDKLMGEHHCYSSIVYAIAAAAVGAAWAVERSPRGGITGFQGGAVMWEFMGAWNGIKGPAKLIEGNDLLYPQSVYRHTTIRLEMWEWLQAEAVKLLDEKHDHVHPDVLAHWQSIRDGVIPGGLTIRD